jgi:2-phosphoglycolate phosphatase
MGQTLLLDLDGTLLDSAESIHRALARALTDWDVAPVALEELRPLIGRPVAHQLAVLRGITGRRADEIAKAYTRHYAEDVRRGVRVFPQVAATLAKLRRFRIGTMTTKRTDQATLVLRQAGLLGSFDVVLGGDRVGAPKPAPDLPLAVLQALGASPRDAVVVGDSFVDIVAGRAAGAHTVAALYGYGDPQELAASRPDATIAAFSQLPRVLRTLGR